MKKIYHIRFNYPLAPYVFIRVPRCIHKWAIGSSYYIDTQLKMVKS